MHFNHKLNFRSRFLIGNLRSSLSTWVAHDLIIILPDISARRNFSWGEARSTKEWLVRDVAAWEVPGGGLRPRTPEKFSKNLKKINEKFTVFENFKGNFAIFSKFYLIFGENLEKNLEMSGR